MWQDHAIALVQVVLTISLLPMIFKKEKPTFFTSIPTSIGLSIIAFTMSTLGLWYSATTAALASFLWFVLICQKIFSKRSA